MMIFQGRLKGYALRTYYGQMLIIVCHSLSGWWYTYPSKKYEFVSWDDDIPNIWKVIKFHGSSHHQPVIYPPGLKTVLITFAMAQVIRQSSDDPVLATVNLGVGTLLFQQSLDIRPQLLDIDLDHGCCRSSH